MKGYGQLGIFIWLCASLTNAQGLHCPQAENLTSVNDDVLFHHFFPSINYVKPVGNPQGHQNITWCCIAAVIQYLRDGCSNTTDIQVDERILNPNEQFPCGATYANNADGASVVRVSHNWAMTHCAGWELSQASSTTQWLQTLVGFLLPSVVFALNVPRGYKFPLRDSLFAKGPIWKEFCFALLAILSAVLDTILWLCIVFAMAGPLLLSGSLEAILDYNMINYLLMKDEQRHHQHAKATALPLALRARMLFTILGGNLELTTAWKHVMNLAQDLDGLDNPTAGSEPVKTLEEDGNPLFRERVFSFDIDVNEAQSYPHLENLDHGQRKLVESYVRAESPASSSALSDQDIQGGLLTHNPVATPMSFHRGRAMSDSLQTARPLLLTRVSSQVVGQPISNSNYLTPPSPNDFRPRRRRYSEKNDVNLLIRSKTLDVSPSPSSQRSVDEKEVQWSLIGRQYLEMYKREKRKKKTVGRIDQRLKAMLACQYSFGSTVGAPVIFYAGSFVYTLVDILQSYGDIDISHALAFGSWWMIIPHIAILSGLLLGGNNPNTLGAIIGAKEESKLQYAFGKSKPNSVQALNDETRYEVSLMRARQSVGGARHRNVLEPLFEHFLERIYADSIYTPVSMWDRGRSKHTWLLILCAESWTSYDWYDQKRLEAFKKELVEFLHETIMLSRIGRVSVMSTTFLLLFIPCTLGTLIAFYTPQLGISCRSLTIVIYMGLQALLLVLWGLQMTYLDDYWLHGRRIIKAYRQTPQATSEQVDKAFWDLHELAHENIVRKPKEKRYVWWQYGYHTLLIFSPVAAIFAAFGGTLLQIIGVYRSSFCHFNITEWVTHSPAMATMSTNDQQDILIARHDWISIGTTSICFLAVTCFSGWVYQKRARCSFDELAITLGEDIQRRCVELEKEANDKTFV